MEYSSGIIQGAQKVVVYGPEGIGKSFFASKFPRPIFEDTEGSTKHMDVKRTPTSSSWTMIFEHINHFKANPFDLDTYVLDTADWAEKLSKEYLCSANKVKSIEAFGYGKGYTYLAEEVGRLLNALTDLIELGINVTIVAHATMRKFEQPDELGSFDRWEMKLEKKVFPLFKEWADMILFANYKTYVVNVDGQGATKGINKVQGGQRVMFTTHHPCWDAKNRHDLLPELPFDFDEIKHCIPVRGTAAPITRSVPPVTKTAEPVTNTAAPQTNSTPPVQTNTNRKPANWDDIDKSEQPKVPKALADLMKENDVSVQEIQQVVAYKGYYPIDTPIYKYDPDFINGVLIGAWPQVYKMIITERENVPF